MCILEPFIFRNIRLQWTLSSNPIANPASNKCSWFDIGKRLLIESPSIFRVGEWNGSRPAFRLALESRRIRCGGGGAAHCLLFRSEAAVAAQPPAAGDGPTTEPWRWWKPTNESRGTPAQITMLIVVAELSAHIPGSFLPPPPGAAPCSSVR